MSNQSANRKIRIRDASLSDVESLFTLINDSYQVETGDSGVAFKKTLRLIDINTEMVPLIPRTLVAELVSIDNENEVELCGSITWEETEHHHHDKNGDNADNNRNYKAMHFGPFSVSSRHQKMGIGSSLLSALYSLARKRGCEYIDLECVNWRSDIIPWYQKMGFYVIGEGPFPAPERCTRGCHFILMRRKVADIFKGETL
jgi:ribosomal protein S18 acetylase RimI-like enzyme